MRVLIWFVYVLYVDEVLNIYCSWDANSGARTAFPTKLHTIQYVLLYKREMPRIILQTASVLPFTKYASRARR